MKLLGKKLILNQPGSVKIIPEEVEDLWLAYNIISTGDTISADTSRKINCSSSGDRKASTARVRIELQIKITAIDYQRDSSAIRVRGKITVANEYVEAGAFHTLELEKNKEFSLEKQSWDEEAISVLKEASDSGNGADLAVVLLNESAANVYLVGKRDTKLCSGIQGGEVTNKSGSSKYFEGVFRAFVKHVDFNTVRCVVIGGPGPTKDDFRRYLLTESQKQKIKSVENNKKRIVVVSTTSGNKTSLKEVLSDSAVMNLIQDTKSAIEIKAFNTFTVLMATDPHRVCYGLKTVSVAHDLAAVETLMITDDLLKTEESAARQKYLELVKAVKEGGGKALVFPAMNVMGEQLTQLTGVAAILRFPVPYLDDLELN